METGYKFISTDGFNCTVIEISGWMAYFKTDCGKCSYNSTVNVKSGSAYILYQKFGYMCANTLNEYFALRETKAWIAYTSMLNRVLLGSNASYRNVKISDKWRCFNEFKKWHDENYIPGFAMDKDLLSDKGNKIYSPETCCYIPRRINSIIQADPRKVQRRGKKYFYINEFALEKPRCILFNTKEEAIQAKTEYLIARVRAIASVYKRELSENVYKKLISLYEI